MYVLRLADERYIEIQNLYNWFSNFLNGSIIVVPSSKKMKFNYIDFKNFRGDVTKFLESSEAFEVFSRIYLISGALRDRIYFRGDIIFKLDISNKSLELSAIDLKGRMGKGSLIFAYQITRQSIIDFPKSIEGITSSVGRYVEDAYEFFSLFDILAFLNNYDMSHGIEETLAETQLFIDKLSINLTKEDMEKAKKIYKRLSSLKRLLSSTSFSFGNFGVLKLANNALDIWNRNLGNANWNKLGTLFVGIDPLYRYREGILGVYLEKEITIEDSKLRFPMIVAFAVQKVARPGFEFIANIVEELSRLFTNYIKRNITYLPNYRAAGIVPGGEGVYTLYIARR